MLGRKCSQEEVAPMEVRYSQQLGNCSLAPVLGWVLKCVATEHLIGMASTLGLYFWIYRLHRGIRKGFRGVSKDPKMICKILYALTHFSDFHQILRRICDPYKAKSYCSTEKVRRGQCPWTCHLRRHLKGS